MFNKILQNYRVELKFIIGYVQILRDYIQRFSKDETSFLREENILLLFKIIFFEILYLKNILHHESSWNHRYVINSLDNDLWLRVTNPIISSASNFIRYSPQKWVFRSISFTQMGDSLPDSTYKIDEVSLGCAVMAAFFGKLAHLEKRVCKSLQPSV